MKSSTRDNVEGKLHQAKGKTKRIVGELANDQDLEAEGALEDVSGKAQEKRGQIKKVVGK